LYFEIFQAIEKETDALSKLRLEQQAMKSQLDEKVFKKNKFWLKFWQ
jgi:hypothetical protein